MREYQKYENNSFPGKGMPKMTDLEKENERLLARLMDVFDHCVETYGSPRIMKELRVNGWTVSVNRAPG